MVRLDVTSGRLAVSWYVQPDFRLRIAFDSAPLIAFASAVAPQATGIVTTAGAAIAAVAPASPVVAATAVPTAPARSAHPLAPPGTAPPPRPPESLHIM